MPVATASLTSPKIFDEIATKIVNEQALLIGPVAWNEAKKVSGLKVDQPNRLVEIINKNQKSQILDSLVDQFSDLFGRTGKEVCKNAVAALLAEMPVSDIPDSLK